MMRPKTFKRMLAIDTKVRLRLPVSDEEKQYYNKRLLKMRVEMIDVCNRWLDDAKELL